MDTSEHYLSQEEEQLLLRIARTSLDQYVRNRDKTDLDQFDLTDNLREKHGAFVTLRHRRQLRGCIGYTESILPLAETVADNAVNACSRDPRFPEVAPEELAEITVEVSALTPGETPGSPFKKVNDVSEIVVGRDGLCITRRGQRGGILLPQVPVEQGWDVPQFLSGVCSKAGYPDRAWEEEGTELYRFSAQVFSESG